MQRIFLDSSVLFSASYSKTGHAHDLVQMSAEGELMIVISNFVIGETRRNLADLKTQRVDEFEEILMRATIDVVHVPKEEIANATHLIVLKDAPIIAAAKIAKVDMLVSLDRKHILGKLELEKYIHAPILTPIEAFQRLKTGK
jgi:predicted nucleic acid-binding protein